MNEAGQDREPVTLLDVVDATVAKLLDVPDGDQAAKFRLLDELADAAGLWGPGEPQFSYAQLKRIAAGQAAWPSAHAETLARVAQAVTEAGTGWITCGDDITDGDDAAAMVIADGSGTCLLVCIPVPAAMTVREMNSPCRPVRIRVDTELAVDLAEPVR